MGVILNWGPSVYPGALDTVANYPDLVDFTHEVIAEHPNKVRDAIFALETKLGITGGNATGFGSIGLTGIAASVGNNTIWVDSTVTPNALTYTNSAGTDLLLTVSTLDGAYDGGGAGLGRSVTADSGAVEITIPDTVNNSAISIVNNDVTNTPDSLEFSGAVTSHTISSTSGLTLTSGGLISFQDQYRSGSTWTATHIPFSNATAEWDTYEANFGEVSLLNAINQAVGLVTPGGSDTEFQYNNAGVLDGAPTVRYDTAVGSTVFGAHDGSIVDPWAYTGYPLRAAGDSVVGIGVSLAANTSDHGGFINIVRGRGTHNSPAGVQADDLLGSLIFSGLKSTSWGSVNFGAVIKAAATETWAYPNTKGARFSIAVTKTSNPSEAHLERYVINGDGSQDFLYDGTNIALTIPEGDPGAIFGSDTADPTTVNGHIYYNSSTNKFRSYENGAWVDLIGGGGSATPGGSDTELQYNNSGAFGGISIFKYDSTYEFMLIGDVDYTDLYKTTPKGLWLAQDDDYCSLLISNSSNSATPMSGITLARMRGTHASMSAVQSGDNIGVIDIRGATGVSTGNLSGSQLLWTAASLWSATNAATKFELKVTKTSGTAAITKYVVNGDGSQEFLYDGTNTALTIPVGEPGAIFGSDTADPTTINGHVYYNSSTNKFRAYENGAWADLISAGGSTSPGGSNTQIQYNNSGSFGGAGSLYWDATNGALVSGDASSFPWTTSAYKFASIAESGYAGFAQIVISNTAAELPFVNLVRARGTSSASPAGLQTDDSIGSFSYTGTSQASWSNQRTGATLNATATENWGVAAAGTKFEIKVTKNSEITTTARYVVNGDGSQDFLYDGTNIAMTIPDGEVGIILGSDTSDPTGVDGQMYYKSDTDELRVKINGSWLTVTAS